MESYKLTSKMYKGIHLSTYFLFHYIFCYTYLYVLSISIINLKVNKSHLVQPLS